MRFVLGADPGLTGAIALLREDLKEIVFVDFEKIDPWEDQVIDFIQEWAPHLKAVAVELVHSSPAQGAMQAAKMNMTSGVLQGLLKLTSKVYEIPYYRVSPQKWQAEIGLVTEKEGLYDDETPEERAKKRRKNKYSLKKGIFIWGKEKFDGVELRKFPEDSNRADALAIAYWLSLQK